MERKDNDCEAFLSRIQQEDWDWRAAWETDPEGVLALISSLTDYVTDHALNDESLLALLRCTRGLDGAYGEGYAGLLNILWQRDQERYLRLWEMLTEEEQNRAIPPDVLAAVNFAGTDAARGWMRSTTG